MKSSFGRLLLAPMTVLVLSSVAMAPVAEAARGGGGGGGERGGARAGGAEGGARQVNNSAADSRTNDVRSTSVNNVNNVNVNKNVNVSASGGCCYNGWDHAYHPVAATAAVVGAVAVTAAVVGSTVAAVPVGCAPVNYGGVVYQQCGGVWYRPQDTQYVVVNPPY